MKSDINKPSIGWVWNAARRMEAGMVGVPVRGGGEFWVSVEAPEAVVSFSAPDPGALMGLAEVFGRQWLGLLLRATGLGGESEDPAFAPPEALSPSWVRLSVVRGLQQWMPLEISDSVLAVDEALAWKEVGMTRHARQLAMLSAEIIVQLHRALHQGLLPTDAVDLVAAACDLALESLPDRDSMREVLERDLAWVAEEAAITELDLDLVRVQWAADVLEPMGYALNMGAAVHPETVVDIRLDPLAVEPRMVRWDGPDRPMIIVTGQLSELRVEVVLTDEVTAADVGTMRIVISNGHDGTIVGRFPLSLVEPPLAPAEIPVGTSGSRAMAVLSLPPIAGTLVLGVESADHVQRTLPVAGFVAAGEHHLIAAWAAQRCAGVSGRGAPEMTRAARQHLIESEQAVVNADAAAGTELMATVGDLRARVRKARKGLFAPRVDGAARPTLAELTWGLNLDEVPDLDRTPFR